MSGTGPPVVRFTNFSAWYLPAEPPVIRNLNLELYRGQLVLVLGATGAGKSCLGLCLNGVIPHILGKTEGSVQVNGMEVSRCHVAQLATQVGIIFQDVESQICNLYVKDEVAFGAENLNLARDEVRQRLDRTLEFLNLSALQDKLVFNLSGGQKQRVTLASVLAMEPRIVFLDEPTANLDPATSREIFQLIARMAREKTVIVVEHKVEELAALADRVIVLHGGTVALDGPPREVFSRHGLRMMEEMGIWIPQPAEIALLLQRERGLSPRVLPLSPLEASQSFQGLRFRNGQPAPAAAPAGDVVIQVEDLEHRYPDGTIAVRGVSLEVKRGEVLAIVGPNGSGKTTLVKHFVGLLRPSRGRVRVCGRDTRRTGTHDLAQEVGFVFQFPEHQFVKDTVEDEVAFSLRAHGVSEAEIAKRLPETLALFGLTGLGKRHPFSLSGGEKRRLSVATMLIARPRVLILDEPTYAQDRSNTQRIMTCLFEATRHLGRSEQPTLILVTHDMKLVAEYATRVVAMREGEKVYDGDVAGLFADKALLESVNLEDPPIFEICRQLRQAGVHVPPHIMSSSNFVASVDLP